MSTQTETEQTVTKPPPLKKRRGFWLLLLILLLVGTFVFVLPLWQKSTRLPLELQQQVQVLRTQVATLQSELQALQSQENQAKLETLQTHFQELSYQQQRLQNHFTALVHQIEQQPQNDDDWKLAEINYLLTIALHRLQLAHDPDGALAALIVADKHLQHLNKPTLLPVRTQLLKDIKRLRELERPDIAGLAVRLAQQIAQADELPLLQGTRATDTPPPTVLYQEQPWQERVWDELKQLVVIRYNTEADSGFLTPGQRALVAQILHLKLESARSFLLRRDTQNFATSISAVRDWLKRYYDQNDNKVNALQKELADMQNIVLNPALPDISDSLNLLQRLSAPSNPVKVQSQAQRHFAQRSFVQ
ncbi:MAG: hypothetical protein DRR19_27450 [Candidatus Parabeggiatoa sp. nov. 1]|nr:MAG: hypothetical protein DRR19_27450 [Gammaproteobacteria bacterium]